MSEESIRFGLFVSISLLLSSPQVSAEKQRSPGAAILAESKIREDYGNLGMSFEKNGGQIDSRVKFLSRGSGYSLFLTEKEAVFSLKRSEREAAVVRMRPVASGARAAVTGVEELRQKNNYFSGSDPKKWITDIPNYAKVQYSSVWPGIDMVFYGNQRQLEYDFVIRAGADTDRIRLAFDGVDSISVNAIGELVLKTPAGDLRHGKPVLYQQAGKERRPVNGKYVVTGRNEVGFQVEAYDKSAGLTIDPTFVYSTFIGGNSYDYGNAIAVDSSGNAYIAGNTSSSDFPGAVAGTITGAMSNNTFVAKLNPSGTQLIYSSVVTATGDNKNGIAVDGAGNAYVVSSTTSASFPVVNSVQAFGGGVDVVAFKLNPAGNALVYSTFLGGSSNEQHPTLAIDSSGNAYIAGQTSSTDFPASPGAYGTVAPSTVANLSINGFVTKLNSAGSRVYSTYLGPTAAVPTGLGVAADAAGNAYVTGEAYDGTFPLTQGAFTNQSASTQFAFVTKINPAGTSLVYSAKLGRGRGVAVAVDASNNAFVTGYASDSTFSTTSGPAFGGSTDGFVAKLDPSGSALLFSRFFGGSRDDYPGALAIDSSSNVYVAGATTSADFPLVNPVQSSPVGFSSNVFSSADGGDTWTAAGSIPSSFPVCFLRVDPLVPATVYGLLCNTFTTASISRLYKSTDSGNTWTALSSPAVNQFGDPSAFVVDPVSPLKMYIADFLGGIFASVDGGVTWTYANTGLPSRISMNSLAVDPTNPSVLYAGSNQGLFKTSNGTANWSAVGGGLPAGVSVSSVAADPGAAGTLYAGFLYAFVANMGVFRSMDGGASWVLAKAESGAGATLTIAAPGRLYEISSDLYFTRDGGSTWSLRGHPTGSPSPLVVDPGNPEILYGRGFNRIYKSTDGGFSEASTGIFTHGVGALSVTLDASNPSKLYASAYLFPAGFVVKFDSTGSYLYSTLLAGSSEGATVAPIGASGIAVDSTGNAYITGTDDGPFPATSGSYQTKPASGRDAYATKISDFTSACSINLSSASQSYAQAAETGFTVVTAPSGCSWTAVSDSSWLFVSSGSSGTGSGAIFYSVRANFGTGSRSGNITVTGSGTQTFSVSQSGGGCTASGLTLNQAVTKANPGFSCLGPSDFYPNYIDDYTFAGTAGQQISIQLNSSSFDAVLHLQDPNGSLVSDGDGGGGAAGTNARIPKQTGCLSLPVSGTYIVSVSSQDGRVGPYTLTLSSSCATSPDLTITQSHSSPLASGQIGAQYSLMVSNIGVAPSSGTVTVTDQLLSGLTATGMSGSGWTCTLATATCTRSDALDAGSAFPPIVLTVNVSSIPPSILSNIATVSNGGDANVLNNVSRNDAAPGITSKAGVFRQGYFWLFDADGNQQFNTPPDKAFAFGGIAGDIPITGDWNGDGRTKAGIYRPLNGLFILDSDGNGQFDMGDTVFNLGAGTRAGDIPVVGDWNGDGRTKVGIFRQGFLWILDYNGNGVFEPGVDKLYPFGGVAGDVPVVGDWNGSGASKIGVVRQGFFWILDTNGNGAFDPGLDATFPFGGIAGDVPIVGDWNGSGTTKPGIFRQGFLWILDANGNYQFDGTGAGLDQVFAFGGIAGDKPVVGKW